MKCISCGNEFDVKLGVCPYCGTVPDLSDIRICEKCGAEILEGNRYCINCGASAPVKIVEDEKVIPLPKKKGGGKILILLGLFGIALAGVLFFVLKPGKPAPVAAAEPNAIILQDADTKLYGLMTREGKMISGCTFSSIAEDFYKLGTDDYMVRVSKVNEDGKELFGFVTESGVEKIPCKYRALGLFFNCGLVPALGDNGKYGYIDQNGGTIIPFEYDSAERFMDNGLALVGKKKSDGSMEHYFINTKGEADKKFDPDSNLTVGKFDRIGLASVKKDGKKGFMDTDCNIVIKCEYDDFHLAVWIDNLMVVSKNGKYGLIDNTGKEILPMIYDEIGETYKEEGIEKPFMRGIYRDNDYIRVKEGDKYGIVDKSGNTIVPTQYDFSKWKEHYRDSGFVFEQGVAPVDRDGKFGFVNESGKESIPCKYQYADRFRDQELAAVKENDLYGFVDKEGVMVVSCMYNDAGYFCKGLSNVTKDGKEGYIDTTGQEVIALSYDDTRRFSNNGLAPVKQDGKWGYINEKGEMVIQPQFDNGYSFYNFKDAKEGEYIARIALENDRYAFINESGQKISSSNFNSTFIQTEYAN